MPKRALMGSKRSAGSRAPTSFHAGTGTFLPSDGTAAEGLTGALPSTWAPCSEVERFQGSRAVLNHDGVRHRSKFECLHRAPADHRG